MQSTPVWPKKPTVFIYYIEDKTPTSTSLLSLPPTLASLPLVSPYKTNKNISSIAALYTRIVPSLSIASVPYSPPLLSSLAEGNRLVLDWIRFASNSDPTFKSLLPQYVYPPAPLPHPTFPIAAAFSPFATSRTSSPPALRRAIAAHRSAPAIAAQTTLSSTSSAEVRAFWTWWKGRGASAKEKNTHLRLAYGATPTNLRLHQIGRLDSPDCTDCTLRTADSIAHYWFDCPISFDVWTRLSPTFARIAGRTLSLALQEREDIQLVLGLPSLRLSLTPPRRRAVRTFFAITFQELYNAKRGARDGHGTARVDRIVALVERRLERRIEGGVAGLGVADE